MSLELTVLTVPANQLIYYAYKCGGFAAGGRDVCLCFGVYLFVKCLDDINKEGQVVKKQDDSLFLPVASSRKQQFYLVSPV